jgi:hypothetical protein
MSKRIFFPLILVGIFTLRSGGIALAQTQELQPTATDHQFREVFVTAAYSTVFGAAFGASLLPFAQGTTTQNVHLVTSGASVGFMLGSAYALFQLIRGNLAPRPTVVPNYSEDQFLEGIGDRSQGDRGETGLFSYHKQKLELNFPALAFGPRRIDVVLLEATF